MVPNPLNDKSRYFIFKRIIGPIRQLITRQIDEIQDKPIFSGPALTILKSRYQDASQWLGTTALVYILLSMGQNLETTLKKNIWTLWCALIKGDPLEFTTR